MKLSVIVPTHNRAPILKTCLEKLIAQEGVDFEIIVVDDGSMDDTEKVVKGIQQQSAEVQVHYIKQPASHQAVARNRGVKFASGDIIVFIGDDIFVELDFLVKHLNAHVHNPDENVAVLGFTTWDPMLKITDYMKFLESSGWQFGYGFLESGLITREDPYKFFYTSNISVKKSMLEKEKFDENFTCYGWEDIELAYRLCKKHGMKIFYEPHAIAFHHHFIDESGLPLKMQNVGKSGAYFQKLQSNIDIVPKGYKALILKVASNPVTLPVIKLFSKEMYYKLKSWREFFKGAAEAE